MSTLFKNFKEYRCACGKLLFKGALSLSIIEIKCRRCGTVKVFDGANAAGCLSFTLFVDEKGVITDICHTAETMGLERAYCIGKSAAEVCPTLRDAPSFAHVQASPDRMFEISHNTLVLRDNTALQVKSIIVPRNRELNAPGGYYIFNVSS